VGDYMFPEKLYCTAQGKTSEERIAALDNLFGV
jgi:hypothetical protein